MKNSVESHTIWKSRGSEPYAKHRKKQPSPSKFRRICWRHEDLWNIALPMHMGYQGCPVVSFIDIYERYLRFLNLELPSRAHSQLINAYQASQVLLLGTVLLFQKPLQLPSPKRRSNPKFCIYLYCYHHNQILRQISVLRRVRFSP